MQPQILSQLILIKINGPLLIEFSPEKAVNQLL
jgi:hypothetical protein